MLEKLFGGILNMSLTGALVIAVICLLRFPLKKLPKVFSYALWLIVLFRLLCPFTPETPVGLFEKEDLREMQTIVLPAERPQAPVVSERPETVVHEETIAVPAIKEETAAASQFSAGKILPYLWLSGVGAMLLYSALSYHGLKERLLVSVPAGENVYYADQIDTPFVLGLIRPKIYLPSSLSPEETGYILLHERYHIRRKDPWVKALYYLALCLHWFNPLVWLAFFLAERDMEMSCDEAVISELGEEIRPAYSASLLRLAAGRKLTPGMPLAFGEGDTGKRIVNLANWKRPKVIVLALALLLCLAAGIGLLTDRNAGNTIELKKMTDNTEVQGMELKDLQYSFRLKERPQTVTFQAEYYRNEWLEDTYERTVSYDLLSASDWKEIRVISDPNIMSNHRMRGMRLRVTAGEKEICAPVVFGSSNYLNTTDFSFSIETVRTLSDSRKRPIVFGEELTLGTYEASSRPLPDSIPVTYSATLKVIFNAEGHYFVQTGEEVLLRDHVGEKEVEAEWRKFHLSENDCDLLVDYHEDMTPFTQAKNIGSEISCYAVPGYFTDDPQQTPIYRMTHYDYEQATYPETVLIDYDSSWTKEAKTYIADPDLLKQWFPLEMTPVRSDACKVTSGKEATGYEAGWCWCEELNEEISYYPLLEMVKDLYGERLNNNIYENGVLDPGTIAFEESLFAQFLQQDPEPVPDIFLIDTTSSEWLESMGAVTADQKGLLSLQVIERIDRTILLHMQYREKQGEGYVSYDGWGLVTDPVRTYSAQGQIASMHPSTIKEGKWELDLFSSAETPLIFFAEEEQLDGLEVGEGVKVTYRPYEMTFTNKTAEVADVLSIETSYAFYQKEHSLLYLDNGEEVDEIIVTYSSYGEKTEIRLSDPEEIRECYERLGRMEAAEDYIYGVSIGGGSLTVRLHRDGGTDYLIETCPLDNTLTLGPEGGEMQTLGRDLLSSADNLDSLYMDLLQKYPQ